MSSYEFVGVDIAKDKFDIALSAKNHYKHAVFENNEKDIAPRRLGLGPAIKR